MSELIDCPECDGEGEVERDVWVRQSSTWHGDFGSHMEECEVCNGIGQIDPLEDYQ